jgi:hypothetical protein
VSLMGKPVVIVLNAYVKKKTFFIMVFKKLIK